jgi:hypothetical protein
MAKKKEIIETPQPPKGGDPVAITAEDVKGIAGQKKCSKCGKEYLLSSIVRGFPDLCPDCGELAKKALVATPPAPSTPAAQSDKPNPFWFPPQK